MREPIAKLRLSALSKARSPSPLPSPSGRGSIIGTVFLIVFVLTAFAALSAPAAPMKIEVQLIWGTTNQVSPNAEHKAIGPELKKKLQDLPLKWTNYFEVKRIDVDVPSAAVATVPLSEKCRLEITDRGHSTIQVVLFGKGEKVINRTQALPKGETLILGGNAPGATSWFAVLRRLN